MLTASIEEGAINMDEKEKKVTTPTTSDTPTEDAATDTEQAPAPQEKPVQPDTQEADAAKSETEKPETDDEEHANEPEQSDDKPDEPPAVVASSDEPTSADAAANVDNDLNARVGWLTTQLLTAKATAAATALGVSPEKAKYALRLADLSQIDVTSEDADKAINAAIGQVIKDLPELTAKPQQTTGTPGMFARQSSTPMTPFERGLMGK